MGLFSSKYETTVGTVVSRVIQDETLPNASRDASLGALLKGNDLVESIRDGITGSLGVRAERMFNYGRDHYTHGLPSGQFLIATRGRAEVTALLEALGGEDVTLQYCHFQPPNMQHIGWMRLVSDHGYNPDTNEFPALSAIKGFPVYLDDMTLVIPDAQFDTYSPAALEQWGEAATAGFSPTRKNTTQFGRFRVQTPVSRDPAAGTAHVRIDYCWEEPKDVPVAEGFVAGTEIFRESFTISVGGFDDGADHFQVMYLDGDVIRYWMYKAGTGTYPTLDVVFNEPAEVNGTFFPFTYFRYEKDSEVDDKTTDAYKTSKKLVKFLGMDYDTVGEAIDENPDIADVEQAMMIMAVPANSTNPLELRYLFKFFDNLFIASPNQFTSPLALNIAQYQSSKLDITKSSLVIQDARFKMALSNGGITKRRRAGIIGPKNTYTFAMEELLVARLVYDPSSETVVTEQVPFKVHVYRRQVTFALYEEIRVVDLKMIYHIFGEYTATADEDDAILLIPLDHSITEDYSVPDREELYARSLHYVFNSRVVTEVKWYQQDWFQFAMIVVAVVITIVSLGTGAESLALAIASGSTAAISAATFALLTDLLIGLAIGQVLKLVVKAVGIEGAIFLAVLAAAYGAYSSYGAGAGVGLPGAPWAQEMLQLASGLAKAATENLQDLFQGLASEYQALTDLGIKTQKELAEANKLLENNNWLSPIVIFGETPDDYYNRTIHSGNIGILSIGAISSYVDIALTLPKLNDTIGDLHAT